ncbi:hypothetical protein [Kocuria turfanensis]|uniref:Uncharacterized protein n=1 Tax=Kocuria turfanensis TaxID=388357 RepID=A0A512IA76_9MICC|nr:hypothetical protein [Kocuria turfanensis]GEO94604.1 hypothetical protein KTU01_07270 [Kocuria turfanensis]
MTPTPLFTDAQRYLHSGSPAGLTVTRFEIVDDVAELTVAFTPEALERVLRSQLEAVEAPADWDCPQAPTEAGSPTWAYALELSRVFNEHYFSHVLLERHEAGFEALLAAHGHEGTPVVAKPDYTPASLLPILRRLKTEHLSRSGDRWSARAA